MDTCHEISIAFKKRIARIMTRRPSNTHTHLLLRTHVRTGIERSDSAVAWRLMGSRTRLKSRARNLRKGESKKIGTLVHDAVTIEARRTAVLLTDFFASAHIRSLSLSAFSQH